MRKMPLYILAVLTIVFAMPFATVYAADTKVDFDFSRNIVTYRRGTNGAIAQTPMVTVKGVAEPGKVEGYSVTYSRTHKGDGSKLRTPDKATPTPSIAGTYAANVSFKNDVAFVCKNGKKSQEYTGAFVIKRAEQPMPILRSASIALVDNEERTGGTIKVGEAGVISIAWASGLKPILTWTAGSDQVVTPESGKPARFTAKASGTAVLTAVLPEDNNNIASAAATYSVKIGGISVSNPLYDIVGESKLHNDWYTSDVNIVGKNGFNTVVSEMGHPVATDGIINFKFALENDSGGTTSPIDVIIKRDVTPPVIDNFTVNDSPWVTPPEDDSSAWAADADLVLRLDVLDSASGIAKVEYRLDSTNYISDTNSAFAKEGCKNHEFSLTIENSGHMLWVRATDTAGNVNVREFLLPKGEEVASQSNSESESESQSESEIEKITTPTQAMNDVTQRLDYLIRSHIEATVRGDVRANADYIGKTLEMFTALTPPEREALGEEALGSLRQYFEMLYTVQEKDIAQLAPLFIFEKPKPPESSTSSSSQASSSSLISSQSISSSVLSPESQDVSQDESSKPLTINNGEFNFTYLIPLVVFIAAIAGYFMYKKSLNKKSKFQLPNDNNGDNDFSEFGGFNDMDE